MRPAWGWTPLWAVILVAPVLATPVLAAPVLSAPVLAQRPLAEVSSAQLGTDERVIGAAQLDFDGDGVPDLAVVGRGESKARRFVTLFRGATRSLTRGTTVELPPDITAWSVGDLHADAGDEVLLFTARGAYAWRPAAEGSERFTRLVEAEFLWQLPEAEDVILWEAGVRDLDRDGLDDLVLPRARGYSIAIQRRGDEGARFDVSDVAVPLDPLSGGTWISASAEDSGWRGARSENELSLTLSVGAGVDEEGALPSTLLHVRESVPAPQLVDWDADGDLDLLVQTSSELHVWRQAPGGSFASAPDQSLPLPVIADRKRRLDPSYSSHVLDLSGDGRADCAIVAGDQRADSVRTQGQFFVHDPASPEEPLFKDKGKPQDLLIFAGFVADVDLQDVDSDGLPDLVVASVRPDLLDQLRSVSSESLDSDLHVYLNQGGRFSRRPELAHRLNIKLRQFDLTARFLGDVTGDGTSELLVRDRPESLRLLMVRPDRRGTGLSVIKQPLWQLDLEEHAGIRIERRHGADSAADVLVLETRQVLRVRFP